MKRLTKNAVLVSLCVGLTAPALVACTNQPGANSNTERTLRIATSMGYGPNDEWFRQRFTELFEFANPNIKIEIIPTMDESYYYGFGKRDPNEKPQDPLEKLKELMQGDNPPDIAMVSFDQLDGLITENLLTQLDPMIQKDKFDTSDIVPAVMDGLKQKGDGKLYALAPTFSASALIYNKQMFDEAGVEYPKDKMTWDEIFDLARRVSKGEGENRKYGFSFSTYSGNDLFYASQTYSEPLQLRMFDDKAEKMTVDTDQWENVWKTILQLKTEKLVPEPIDHEKMRDAMSSGEYNPFQYNDFLMGRVAMAPIHFSGLNEIINANKNAQNITGFTPIDWDVVTMPVHQEYPNIGGSMYMDGIMGINSRAQNPEDAWNFIKFINGEDWARLKSSSESNIVSRKKYIKNMKDGVEFNVDAFTTLIPAPNVYDTQLYREKEGLYQVHDLGRQAFEEAAQNKMTVREALKKWQTDGDAVLQQIKANPNGPVDQGGGAIAVPAG